MGNTKASLFDKKATSWFKGMAIIMVILSHFAEWWSWFYPTEGLAEDIRFGCAQLGPYGVAIFFLFSGYGLSKSAGDKRIGLSFICKRLQNVYLPYLLVTLIIQILSKAVNLKKIWYGADFWYMTVLFMFYLAFIIIWLIVKNKHIRVILFAAATFGIIQYLFLRGDHSFWYVSNPAFLIGVLCAAYEEPLKKAFRYISIPGILLGCIGMYFVTNSGLHPELQDFATPEAAIKCQTGCVLLWTFLIMCIAAVWKYYDPVIGFLGKASLYLYITHTYIFMQIINMPSLNGDFKRGFIISTFVILAVSIVLHLLFTQIFKWAPRLYKKIVKK